MRSLVLVSSVIMLTLPSAGALGIFAASLDEPGEVLVGYAPGALPNVTKLVRSLGGTVIETHEEIRVVLVEAGSLSEFLTAAPLSPLVEFVERNDVTRQTGTQWNGAEWNGAEWNGAEWNGAQWNGGNGSDESAQWGLGTVDAATAWNITTGTRTAELCVLDTGLAWDHPDIAANAWTAADGSRGHNAIDPRAPAYDDAGHGTHVAGIAAASVADGVRAAGVGDVTILPVKVLGADGTGREDDLAEGLVWCANHGADVALMSLSVDDEGPTVRRALDYAAKRDVLLVASAGNGGSCSGCVAYPARDRNVLAVSAIDRDGALAPFSSQGAQVALAAPGKDILSTFLNDGYASGSGTSQAAAFVAGAAALVRDAHPDLSASATRDALTTTARDLGSAGKDARFGHGAVDVAAALGSLA